MATPILVHLSEYMYELYHFYTQDPQILTIQFSLLLVVVFHSVVNGILW